jgi:hypothetical protein
MKEQIQLASPVLKQPKFVVCHQDVSCHILPPNRRNISEFTSGCSNPSIFREFKACKYLFNNQFPRNISIRIIFAIKRWYLKLEFMKSIIIIAYLMSSMATPAIAIMIGQTVSIVVVKF